MLVGGSTYWVQNAQKSWSITNPTGDSSSLRFEVRQGDVWAQGDGTISPLKNRSEIAGTTQYSVGTDIHVKYGFTVEPGAANTASWMTTGQFRQAANDPVSAPFGIMFTGEHMRIYAAEGGSSGQNFVTLYQDPNNIVRGHEYQMQIDARFDPAHGHLDVIRDGVTLVNYDGPLGWDNMGSVYWKEGVYRADTSESIAMDYNHLSITTGAATNPNTLQGGDGADTLAGTSTNAHIFGGAGDDVISSTDASDTINGNTGNDTVHGGSGHDVISGGRDNDALFGDSGASLINGNLGDDTIFGGAASSTLRGGAGNDAIVGGAGADQIWGDKGSDLVKGGGGADTFHTFAGAGITTVLDFNPAEGDRVRIDDGAHFTTVQVGADVVVDLGNGSEVVLQNAQLSALQPGWIF
jgi:Ca2+-binding RTX toxin-like protein